MGHPKMLHRLKSKVLRRQAVAESAPQRTDTAVPRAEKLGLHFVAESPPDPSGSKPYAVDIVAVHGLNGDAFSTWRHSNGTLWLRDLLPTFLPGCRVYTYGYPSKIFSESSLAGVQEYARGLLSSIRDLQEDSKPGRRPVIFVCHSLGGIVCKQALVFAHENDKFYSEVIKSIIGVAFLGTPHRGSGSASLASVFATIINICVATASVGMRSRTARADLLDHLSYNSDVLQDLLLSARNPLHNLTVVSFYETEPTPPLPTLIVDRASSILHIPNEDVIPMYENHKSICRFPSETKSYLAVAKALRRIAGQSSGVNQALGRTSTRSSDRTLSDVEKACVTLLNTFDVAEYKQLLPKPITGTGQWIHSHPLFISWLEKRDSALLWLTGHPGCGKTMLAFSLAQYFEEVRDTTAPQQALIYFCDDKISKQKDAKAVLAGLIFQIINSHRSMIRHVRRVYELQGPSMIQSFSSLWSILLRILKDPKAGFLYIILDALDECEDETRHQLLEAIFDFLHSSRNSSQVKFIITSRPFLQQSYANNSQALLSQISIDENQAGYVADLQKFIQRRVEEISLKRRYPSEVKEFLLQTMSSKADQTFLWIHVVLASVEKSLLTSMKDFRNIVAKIPPDLEQTYWRYLSAIPADHQDDASHLLKLLLASSRPLHLDEINIAFTIGHFHVTTEEVMQDTQTAISHTLQGILGPLARISGPQVSLVHQSVKEFLLQATRKHESFPAIRTVDVEGSALRMASACIQYLLLEDFQEDFFSAKNSFTGSVLGNSGPGDFSGDFWDEDYDFGPDILFTEPDAMNPEICRLLASKYSFYSYASLHWAKHFAICQESASDELRNAARSLLDVGNDKCRNWLHFYRAEAATSIDDRLVDQDPIVLSAYFNLHKSLTYLLGNREPSEATKDKGLFWAAQLGHNRVVATLLTAGASPNTRGLQRQTPLTVASEHGFLACVITLLADDRTNINIQGQNGRTALSFACSNGHHNIVKELLSRNRCGADDTDNSGATPFFWAVGGGYHTIISTLARHPNVNINHRDKTGRTAVSWAAGDGMDEVLRYLLKLPGIDVNTPDAKGKSPLSWAAGNGCANTVDVLLQCDEVDKSSVDKDKRSAISWACERGHLNALRILLKSGCPGVDTVDIDGWTPLAWAIQTNSPQVVEALISTRLVDLEHHDNGGRTALSWAVEYGHISVVRVLLQEGADPEAKSERGTTPISVAQQFGRTDILSELLNHNSSEKIIYPALASMEDNV